MILSPTAISRDAIKAGWPAVLVPTVIAIAYAESGGDDHKVSPRNSDGTTDYGLMQINSSHADLLKTGDWTNPIDNLRMAKNVYDHQGFGAWTTYRTGKYLKYTKGPQSDTGKVYDPGASVDSNAGFTRSLNNALLRIGMFIFGFALIVLALSHLSGVDPVKTVTKAAKVMELA